MRRQPIIGRSKVGNEKAAPKVRVFNLHHGARRLLLIAFAQGSRWVFPRAEGYAVPGRLNRQVVTEADEEDVARLERYRLVERHPAGLRDPAFRLVYRITAAGMVLAPKVEQSEADRAARKSSARASGQTGECHDGDTNPQL